FVVLCAAFAALAFELAKKPVTVILDGEKQTTNAHAETGGELVSVFGVDVGEHDAMTPGLARAVEAGLPVDRQTAVWVNWAHNAGIGHGIGGAYDGELAAGRSGEMGA